MLFRSVVHAAAAGAVAVWVMDRFDWFAFEHENPHARQRTEAVRPGGMDPAHALAFKTAAAIGAPLKPAPPHQHPSGLAVHYAVPIGLAILYQILKPRMPVIRKGRGTLYGAGVFAVLDEVVSPILGLAAAPARYPWQRHVRELTANMIFGVVTNAALQIMNSRTAPNNTQR
jgi:hypothetical protein